MTLPVLLQTALVGLQVNCTATPVESQGTGTVNLDITIEEDHLLLAENLGSWETIVYIDEEMSVRTSGCADKEQLPFIEHLSISSITSGEHDVSVFIRDLESGSVAMWEGSIVIPVAGTTGVASGSLQLPQGRYFRAEGAFPVLWDINVTSDIAFTDSIAVGWVIKDENGNTYGEGWMELEEPDSSSGNILRYYVSVDVDGFEPGEYELLTAAVGGKSVVATSKGDIELLQYWDVWGENPEITERLIRPIATNAELNALSEAEGVGSRALVMSEFWLKRDYVPGTVNNEYLEEYTARLDYVDEHFSIQNTMGIITDQGRAYVLLGKADIIEDRPVEISTMPTIVWIYFTPPLEILFIDRDGYGHYELSADWEEVYSVWERR